MTNKTDYVIIIMQGEQKQRRVENTFTAKKSSQKKIEKILKKGLTNKKQSDKIKSRLKEILKPLTCSTLKIEYCF